MSSSLRCSQREPRTRSSNPDPGVQAVETAARLAGETDRSPPSDEHMQQMQALERSVLSSESLKSVVRDASGEGGEETTEPVGTAEAFRLQPDLGPRSRASPF